LEDNFHPAAGNIKEDLRQTAPKARDALCAGGVAALGAAMSETAAAQRRLRPALFSQAAKGVC
jgi:hypothetical protein